MGQQYHGGTSRAEFAVAATVSGADVQRANAENMRNVRIPRFRCARALRSNRRLRRQWKGDHRDQSSTDLDRRPELLVRGCSAYWKSL
jgi:hypothetical protein